MTMYAICEEREYHWSQQLSATVTTQWLQHDQILSEGCGLQD